MTEQVAGLEVAVSVCETLALEGWQTLQSQTMQGRIVVVGSGSCFYILALSVKRTYHLWPFQDAVYHPVTVAAVSRENFKAGLGLRGTHLCRRVMKSQRLRACIIKPYAFASVKQGIALLEHYAVPSLIQMARCSVHIPRDGQVAVVVCLVT